MIPGSVTVPQVYPTWYIFLKHFIELACDNIVVVIVRTVTWLPTPKSRSDINVDVEEIMSHIEATTCTFGADRLRTQKKKSVQQCAGFRFFPQASRA